MGPVTCASFRACTGVTRSHLPWARALAASLAVHHAGGSRLTVLVSDDPSHEVDPAAEPFDVLRPEDIGIDHRELRLRAAIYRPMEFTGSMRASLLATVLDRTAGGPVIFLDADVDVLGSLEPLIPQITAAGIVLSPHLLGPPPEPLPLERELLRAGAYNCGYVGVAGEAGRRFSTWWAGHLARDCLDAPSEGLFVSQRWLDLAPSLFDVAMLRDPGSNVTSHNAGSRAVVSGPEGWTIDGRPLRFLHVGGGFDPRATEWPWLTRDQGLTAVCLDYARRLLAAGHKPTPSPAYRYAQSEDGLRIDPWVRRRCRAAAISGETFPDPFDPETACDFTRWLSQPEDDSSPPVPRWALALRDFRTDLRATFFDVPGQHSPDYLRWLAEQREVDVPDAFRPDLRSPSPG